MLSNARPITPELVEAFRSNYENDAFARTLTAAASGTDFATLSRDPQAACDGGGSEAAADLLDRTEDHRNHQPEIQRTLLAVRVDESDA